MTRKIALILGFSLLSSVVWADLTFNSVRGPSPDEAKSLVAAGGTFPATLYKEWFSAYDNAVGVKIDYAAVGSGEGIKKISREDVDFAGSDAPMTPEQLANAKGGPILHIPTAFGSVAITYNIPGLTTLRLTPTNIADIYLGNITRWNDSRLLAHNPSLSKVPFDIITVHRSEGSGTTYGFTDFLSSVDRDWATREGRDTSIHWPIGIGAKKNDGVAALIQTNPYSIGYVEMGFALKNNLSTAAVLNRAGEFILPSVRNVIAATRGAATTAPDDLRFSIVNPVGAGAYPIGTGTWLLIYKNQQDKSKALAMARLAWWATHEAQSVNQSLHYAPVPSMLLGKIERLIRSISVNGEPVYSGP